MKCQRQLSSTLEPQHTLISDYRMPSTLRFNRQCCPKCRLFHQYSYFILYDPSARWTFNRNPRVQCPTTRRVTFTHGPILPLNSNIRLTHLNMNGCLHRGANSTVLRGKMLQVDILLHKFRLYSSFYNAKSYTNLSLMMSGQKIVIQNFPMNLHL